MFEKYKAVKTSEPAGWIEQEELCWQALYFSGSLYNRDGYERSSYYETEQEAVEAAKEAGQVILKQRKASVRWFRERANCEANSRFRSIFWLFKPDYPVQSASRNGNPALWRIFDNTCDKTFVND